MLKSARGRFLSLSLLLIVSVSGAIWFFQRRHPPTNPIEQISQPVPTIQTQASPIATSSPEPTPTPTQPPPPPATPSPVLPEAAEQKESTTPSQPVIGYAGKLNLVIPVAGVRADQLLDTFDDARLEGRVHDAIDISAPQGTPVLAAADGEIIKLFQSERGGTTIYQLSKDKKLVYYYAHLDRYADGLTAGKQVRQGEVIAYVGDTGNAGAGNYHLHFSIAVVIEPGRYWEGTNINPYPLLGGKSK
jgi:murein DD-endopeptidase MepM/ murein hydrolase activator NlpD